MQHNVIGLYEPILDPRKRACGIDKDGYYRYNSDDDSMLHFFDVATWMAINFAHLPVDELCRIFRAKRYTTPYDLEDAFATHLELSFPMGYTPSSAAHVAELAKILNVVHVAPFIEPTVDYVDVFERYEWYVRDNNAAAL